VLVHRVLREQSEAKVALYLRQERGVGQLAARFHDGDHSRERVVEGNAL